MVLEGRDGGTGVRGGGCRWRWEGKQWKDDKVLQGQWGWEWACRGVTEVGRKGSEDFRVNMMWLVYPYTTTSPPLDL